MSLKTVLAILFFLLMSVVYGQNADTVLTRTNKSSLADSLTVSGSTSNTDSTAVSDSTKSSEDINSVIYVSASDSVSFSISKKKMKIYGNGKLNYEKSELKGGNILVDFNTNDIESFGIKDTADTSSSKFMQTPVLSEGNDTYKGQRLKYNFKTKQGFISLARNDTKKDSRYEGAKVKKIDEGTYYIEDGMFTTCESDTPHTHFTAKRMKIVDKKIIIAEWIWMHIAQIPMPVPLPFGVFPMQSGRRSGIIVPTFTSAYDKGQIIRDFGYYWAISDYMDLKLTGDYYTRGGYAIGAEYRYKKLYNYDGTVSLKFSDQYIGEEGDPNYQETQDWRIYLRHNQQLNPTSNLSANLTFQTGSFNQNNSNNAYNGLKQNISSNATYNKRWDGASLTASYSRTQNLITNKVNETLPDIRFSKSRFYPFASKNSNPSNKSWYEEIAVSYNSELTRKKNSDQPVRGGIQHRFSLSAAPRAGYINISPTFNYTERWYDRYTRQGYKIDSTADGKKTYELQKEDVYGFNRVVDFSLGFSMGTKLYGMLNLNSFGIEAIRHTITPTISYSYRPDFSEQKWGYYDTYIDTTGAEVEYNKYQSFVFGAPSSGESQFINLSINNVWEMKTQKDPTDTTSKAQKIRLLSLTANTGYNLAVDSLRLSDLRLSFRTEIGSFLNLSGTNVFTFYDTDANGKRINKFLVSQGKGLMKMTNFSLNLSTNLSGEKIAGREDHSHDDEDEPDYNDLNNTTVEEELFLGSNRIRPDFSLPWNLGLNLSYSYTESFNNIRRSARVGFNGGFNLTPNWKFTFNGSYDFIKEEFASPTIAIHRSLHCWEMNFSWTPTGYFRSYNFEIRMTAPMFKDIKVEKSRGIYTGLRR